LLNSFEKLYDRYPNYFSHYFRYLYTIFKFIKESEINDKKFYSNIVRSQLSDAELVILFYNCVSPYGRDKFLPIAIEFKLFDNLPKSRLLSEDHVRLADGSGIGEKVN